MSSNVIGINQFESKLLTRQLAALQLKTQGSFADLATVYPEDPIWPTAVSLMGILMEEQNADYLADIRPSVTYGDNSRAVVFGIYVEDGEEPAMFLSIQSTERGAIPLSQAVPAEALEEMFSAIKDINSNDTTPAPAMIDHAFQAIIASPNRVTGMDGDPEENIWSVQSYTDDGKYILDVQVDYLVIQEYLDKSNKPKEPDDE